jgi:hypothetical protein
LLYDFDYESDRLVLVQALLLMTYWYETPDDQKDTWHWMGVAISLAHTIGLHRNPVTGNAPVEKHKLWKRIWWSCFMRDRLIALGMRRPTRIKDEDFDVPMLEPGDFEIQVLSEDNQVLPASCTMIRDVTMQRELAQMCIQKAKLCVCISHVLKAQYSVFNRESNPSDTVGNSPENSVPNSETTMMLYPNKAVDNTASVISVDKELDSWLEGLPVECRRQVVLPAEIQNGRSTVATQRCLLHMVYHTTVSALHRPRYFHNNSSTTQQAVETSRNRVLEAAKATTDIATEMHHMGLDRYLPTTGVTVMIPAMIIHLLKLRSPILEDRMKARENYTKCMKVMNRLQEVYAAADFATGFLEAALYKSAGGATVPPSAAMAVEAQAQASQIFMPQPTMQGMNVILGPGLNLDAKSGRSRTTTATQSAGARAHAAPYLFGTDPNMSSSLFQDQDFTLAEHPSPLTDPDSVHSAFSRTPSSADRTLSSSSGDGTSISQDMGQYDMNFAIGSGLGSGGVNFDEFLQFPAEGVSNEDETFVTGNFWNSTETTDKVNIDSRSWHPITQQLDSLSVWGEGRQA